MPRESSHSGGVYLCVWTKTRGWIPIRGLLPGRLWRLYSILWSGAPGNDESRKKKNAVFSVGEHLNRAGRCFFAFLCEFQIQVIDVPVSVLPLLTSQHSRIRRKFTKDGGRTRRWCRGALFQVSLKTVRSTLMHGSFPQNTDVVAYTLTTLCAWSHSQSLLHI